MSRPRILLLGATGQVGSALTAVLGGRADLVCPPRSVADLTRPDELRAAVRAAGAAVVINTAAYTAVDRAEADPEAAYAVNAVAPGVLAEEASRLGALLIHYSTDYVFDGAARVPYAEHAPTAPLSVYGRTKLEGDRRIMEGHRDARILRTSWVYGPSGTNFLLTMRRLMQERDEVRVVDDQWGVPTTADFLARAAHAVLGRPEAPGGVYHVTAAGATTWCGFARAIHDRLVARGTVRCRRVVPIVTADYPVAARRPSYSVLDGGRFSRTFGLVPEGWEVQLDRVMRQLP